MRCGKRNQHAEIEYCAFWAEGKGKRHSENEWSSRTVGLNQTTAIVAVVAMVMVRHERLYNQECPDAPEDIRQKVFSFAQKVLKCVNAVALADNKDKNPPHDGVGSHSP